MATVGQPVWYASERKGLKAAGEPRRGRVQTVFPDGELIVVDDASGQGVKVLSEHTAETQAAVMEMISGRPPFVRTAFDAGAPTPAIEPQLTLF